MPWNALTEEQLQTTVDALVACGNRKDAAERLGVSRQTIGDRLKVAVARGMVSPAMLDSPPSAHPSASTRTITPRPPEFTAPEVPSEVPSVEELLARRRNDFARKATAHDARSLIRITVTDPGPIGVLHMGDPHVDDDGTDISLLESHVALINRTPGLFAGNVGDYSNNWIGRLARLYAEQSLSAREAWVLVEWLITSVRWLYLVRGNHDAWSGAGDPVTWITKHVGQRYDEWGARVGLQFPNGRQVRINARHDWKGHSMWNTAHGPAKAAQMGWRDHILTCGHTHVSGYQLVKDPASKLISHAIRCASYKALDRYALEKGFLDQAIFVAPVTIIDPQYADDDPRLITFLPTPEQGADYLTFLRKRKG